MCAERPWSLVLSILIKTSSRAVLIHHCKIKTISIYLSPYSCISSRGVHRNLSWGLCNRRGLTSKNTRKTIDFTDIYPPLSSLGTTLYFLGKYKPIVSSLYPENWRASTRTLMIPTINPIPNIIQVIIVTWYNIFVTGLISSLFRPNIKQILKGFLLSHCRYTLIHFFLVVIKKYFFSFKINPPEWTIHEDH